MNEDVRNQIVADMEKNIADGNTKAFAQAIVEMNNETSKMVEDVKQTILKEFEDYKANSVLPKGFRQCTEQEKKWLDSAILSVKGATSQSLSGIDAVMPETVFNDIFEEMSVEHELIRELDVINTKNKVKWLLNTGIEGTAGWGDLCDEIDDEIKQGFKAEELPLQKLSAYMYVCLTLLDLGYEWLMRFCVKTLAEAIAVALEDAVINGNGSKKPIGMIKDIVVDPEDDTTSIETKTPVELTDMGASSLGSIFATLSNSAKRVVRNVIMVVNSNDYYTKVFPAIAYRNALGEYAIRTALPIKIVLSEAVPSNHAVFGMGKNYKLLLGLGENGKLTYSDDFKFLDDVRTLKQKLVGNGRPMDNNSFVYADITNLKPDFFNVKVEEVSA